MIKRFLHLLLIFTSFFALVGCGVTDWVSTKMVDPEQVLSESQEAMRQIESMRLDGDTSIEGNVLGSTFSYNVNTLSQARLENGVTVETHMETSMEGTGIPQTSERIYFSSTQYGSYDSGSSSWQFRDFNAEDQFFVNLFMSSLDPTNSFNKYADSKMEKTLTLIGNKTINGIPCIGISVQTDADELISEMSPVIKAVAGSAGGLASSLTGALVKNIEQEYWIGEGDKLVHQMNMNLSTPIGDYHSEVTVYDHNEPFQLPE